MYSILCLSLIIISCNTTKKIKYFQDIPDSGQNKTLPKTAYSPLIIHPGDILNINIQTDDPMSAMGIINSANEIPGGTSSAGAGASGASGASGALAALAAGGAGQSQQPVSGMLVDSLGNVKMPILGTIAAAGNTTFQLSDKIYNQAIKYFKHPIVTVRFVNFKVDITGEVLKPGQYIMPDEKESIMDAIAMAGDLTIFGKRENVLLIRQNDDGTKTAYRLNLKKSEVLSSNEYYLRQNDIIYVEPRKAKSDATDASQLKFYSIGAAILSILVIYATRAK